MENKVTNWKNAGIGLLGLGVMGWLTITLFSTLEQAPWQALTVILAVFGSALTIASNFQSQIRSEQREHKREIYEKITHFFFENLFALKLGQEPKTEAEITQFLIQVTPKLVMWGSDQVVKSFREFRDAGARHNSDSQVSVIVLMLIYEQMLLNIRKDLGHQNQALVKGSILGIFINNIDEYIAAISELQNFSQEQSLTEVHPRS